MSYHVFFRGTVGRAKARGGDSAERSFGRKKRGLRMTGGAFCRAEDGTRLPAQAG